MFFFHRKSDSLLATSRKEQYETIEKLISSATWSKGYYLLLVLSICIITPGILMNNTPIVIGGMILAPLMIPILSFSLSLVTGNLYGIIRSLMIIMLSIVITIVVSSLLTFIFSKSFNGIEWIPYDVSSAIYVFIAFCSGVAAAFALVKEDLAPTIAGVAIAVSLLPPLCAAGAGLAIMNLLLIRNAAVIFVANFLGISVAAFLVFWILGFIKTSHIEEKVLKKESGA